MTTLKWIACLMALGLLPGAAHAGFYSGKDLYDTCTIERGQPDYFEKAYECAAYVAGAVDAFNTTREANKLKSCIPPGVTMGRLREVTVNYLRDHPAERKASASTLVFSATRKAWPCEKPAAPKKRRRNSALHPGDHISK